MTLSGAERAQTHPVWVEDPERPSVSVVVCAYTTERWPELVAAMSSVAAQDPAPSQIVLVSDHNPELAARARVEFPDVLVVENEMERGLSGARNTGLAYSEADVVAFLDDDARALPGWLDMLTAAYCDPGVIGVGGAAIPIWSASEPRWFPPEFSWVIGCSWIGLPEQAAGVRNLIGCNMSFRREVFADVGDFTVGMGRVGKVPVGCEETELCIRIHQRRPDAVILYDPGVRVLHSMSADRRRWRYFRTRCYGEGLSKALVADHVGSADGLASERTYVARVLPRGVARGCADAARGDLAGLGRAGAIVAGLAFVAAGYGRGRLTAASRRRRDHRRTPAPGPGPVR